MTPEQQARQEAEWAATMAGLPPMDLQQLQPPANPNPGNSQSTAAGNSQRRGDG